MTALEQRVRETLRNQDIGRTDGIADQVLARIERNHRRRRAIQGGVAAAAVLMAVAAALALSGGTDLRATVPADPTTSPTAARTPTADQQELVAAGAYLAAQEEWAQCLRRHGLKVYGPDANGDVSVNPDPALPRKRDACAALQPRLTDDVERALHPDARPGGQTVTPLGDPVTAARTGTATVRVGPAPEQANALVLQLTCLSAGRFDYPDGANMQCNDADASRPDPATGGYIWEPPAGTQTVTITATGGATWRLTATWVRRSLVPYAVNQYGQTYGSAAGAAPGSEPDLISVEAGNGRTGYVYRDELAEASGDNETLEDVQRRLETGVDNRRTSIPIYERDGRTRIGTFHLR